MEYDILSLDEQISSLSAEGNKITAQKGSHIKRYGVRRFESGMLFQASRLGEADHNRLVQDTKDWGGQGVSFDYSFAPEKVDNRSLPFLNDEFFKAYTEMFYYLSSKYNNYVFSGRCNIKNIKKSLYGSYGIDFSSSAGFCEWFFDYQRKGSGNILDGYFSDISNDVSQMQKTIKYHEQFLAAENKQLNIADKSLPILLIDNMEPLKKLKESFLINKYSEGSSLFSGKVGSNLFHSDVSIIDQNYNPSCGQIDFFDGEGVVRDGELKLIDNGKFVSTISDLRFAKKFQTTSTGNGKRIYNRGVNLGFNQLIFNKGKNSLEKILSKLDRCIVALVSVGGDSNDLGEFSSPVQISYLVEKGEVVGKMPQFTFKTSVDKYLKTNFIEMSSNGFSNQKDSGHIISEVDIYQ